MAGSSIRSWRRNSSVEETVEISKKKRRRRSKKSPIGEVKKVEPPPENHYSPHLDPIRVDDNYFSPLHEDNDLLYGQELEEALIYSFRSTNNASSSPFYSTSTSQQLTSEEIHLADSFCDICMDDKTQSEMFRNEKECSHTYCFDCIVRHIYAKVKENIAKVRCPDPNCEGEIGPEICRSFVPKEVLERWEDALCESLFLGSEKFYCPFKDCSAMLVDDGGETVTSSECPNCNRLFCAQCKVAWHSGMDCREFQKLKKDERFQDDIKLMALAKNKKWKRCPSCKFFVEKRHGCLHIACRCRFHFCYGCGQKYNLTHTCHYVDDRILSVSFFILVLIIWVLSFVNKKEIGLC